jgi:hypothetical protein
LQSGEQVRGILPGAHLLREHRDCKCAQTKKCEAVKFHEGLLLSRPSGLPKETL